MSPCCLGASVCVCSRGECDGWEQEVMIKNVGDATDLLLLLKDLGGPIIAAHIEGGLSPPADPTQVATTPCAVSLFSVCGAFGDDGIIKVEVPRTSRTCGWRAHKGTVTDKDGEPGGKVPSPRAAYGWGLAIAARQATFAAARCGCGRRSCRTTRSTSGPSTTMAQPSWGPASPSRLPIWRSTHCSAGRERRQTHHE